MRSFLIAAGAIVALSGAAFADGVAVQVNPVPVPAPGVVIEKRAADDTTSSTTVHHADGCTTHSTTRTNDNTDTSVTHTQSNC